MFGAHWLLTIAACALAFRWSFSPSRQRLGLFLSLLALASSYWGFTCIRFTITQTTNGRFSTQFDTRWFFTASLALASLAFLFTLWKKWRFNRFARPIAPPNAG